MVLDTVKLKNRKSTIKSGMRGRDTAKELILCEHHTSRHIFSLESQHIYMTYVAQGSSRVMCLF